MKVFLIDGSALAYRSHFAFITNPLKTSKGEETSALFGFVSTIYRLIERENPDMLGVVVDSGADTFRHEKFADYKATREKMPEELAGQLPIIEDAMAALNIPHLCVPGFEADDVIGTLALEGSRAGHDVYIVTGDKDFLQLLDPRIRIYSIKKGETEILDETGSEKKWGVKKDQVRDFMALMGDASDNVPGVPGVGEKTAQKLVAEFGTLENLYANLERVTAKKLRENLAANRDQAFLCRDLVTIRTDLKLDLGVDDLARRAPDVAKAGELFRRFELHSLARNLPAFAPAASAPTAETPAAAPVAYAELNGDDAIVAWLKAVPSDRTVAFFFDPERGLALSAAKGAAAFAPATRVQVLASWLAGPAPKTTFDVKRAAAALAKLGVVLHPGTHDVMIQSYLIDPDGRQNDLSKLAERKAAAATLFSSGFEEVCERADLVGRLHAELEPQVLARGMEKLYREIELPLTRVLADMEARGIAVDTAHLARMAKTMDARIKALTASIYARAGEEFNLNSPKQLGPILFEKLKVQSALPGKKLKKTKTGYSTDQETLELYGEHPVIRDILEYRNLSKLQSTYVTALPKLVGPTDGRIHSSFNQTVAATGRLSSSDPNLQNIPIRTDIGREIREAFVPGIPDGALLSADYSQIELRLLAHFSEDPTLIDTFRKDEDVHARTAALVLGVPQSEVTPQLRSQAKAINFGIVYGMGATRLAKETGLSLAQAKEFIEAYFGKYASIRAYLDGQVDFAKEHGYVKTLFDRIRPLPDIASKNPMLQSVAERVATNSPLQGTAADLIKIAMLRVEKALAAKGLKTRMLLQVHDELVFEAPKSEIAEATKIIRHEMEHAADLLVPLKVEVGSGPDWAHAH